MSLNKAARIGYSTVGREAKQFFYGIWLIVSRYLGLMAWFFVAFLIGGGLTVISDRLAAYAVIAVFLILPIPYGYYQLRQNESA